MLFTRKHARALRRIDFYERNYHQNMSEYVFVNLNLSA
jgi:hypothetical protein